MNIGNDTTATTAFDASWDSTHAIILEIEQYYMLILMCLSLLGNSLSMCVCLRTKLRYFSSSIYLIALAISDTGVLVTIIISWFIKYVTNYDEWAAIFRICFENLFAFISVWLVVAFTVERYVAIKWPLLRRSLCTITRAKFVVLGFTGLAVCYTIPCFVFGREWYILIANNKIYTEDSEDINYRILRIIDLTFLFMLPLIMIVIFNTLIVYNICKQNYAQKNLFVESSTSDEQTQVSGNRTQTKITKMLILIFSTFICINIPTYICWFLKDHYIRDKPTWLYVAGEITAMLWFTNYGINFVFYCASGFNYRRILIRMFTRRHDTRTNNNLEMKNNE